jgi:alpha-D-xyloside xylohydrolase
MMSLIDCRTISGRTLAWLVVAIGFSCAGDAQQTVLTRSNATVVLEGFAPNIVRVTLSLNKSDALKAPGVGIIATPATTGWNYASGKDGDSLASDRMV